MLRTYLILTGLLAAVQAALAGCSVLLPAKVLCYPDPLVTCLARHHAPAIPESTPGHPARGNQR